MINDDHTAFDNQADSISKIDINFNLETPEMIIGAVFVNSIRSPKDTVVGKIFIYKYTAPFFIELNFDESYISYLFDNPAYASKNIADYTLRMLTIDFPGSILNMSSSNDIGLVQLPQTINR
jgi:hypothetical protein